MQQKGWKNVKETELIGDAYEFIIKAQASTFCAADFEINFNKRPKS